MRDADAAQPQRLARRRRRGRRSRGRCGWSAAPRAARSAAGEIRLVGELLERLVARDRSRPRCPAARATWASSVGGAAAPGAVGGEDRVEAEGLRSLDPDQRRRGRRRRRAPPPPRASVSTTGSTGTAPSAPVERVRAAGRPPPAGRKGRAASWIRTVSAPPRPRALRGRCATESCALGAAGDRGGEGPARRPPRVERLLAGADHDPDLVDRRPARARRRRGRAAACRRAARYCLGRPPPARLPLPAATSKRDGRSAIGARPSRAPTLPASAFALISAPPMSRLAAHPDRTRPDRLARHPGADDRSHRPAVPPGGEALRRRASPSPR